MRVLGVDFIGFSVVIWVVEYVGEVMVQIYRNSVGCGGFVGDGRRNISDWWIVIFQLEEDYLRFCFRIKGGIVQRENIGIIIRDCNCFIFGLGGEYKDEETKSLIIQVVENVMFDFLGNFSIKGIQEDWKGMIDILV